MFIDQGCTSEFFERNEMNFVPLEADDENIDSAINISPLARLKPDQCFAILALGALTTRGLGLKLNVTWNTRK